MEEKELSNVESLKLIQQMIAVAKEDRQEDGDGWLIWGWLLLLASLSSLVCDMVDLRHIVGWIWLGMLIVGMAIYLVFHTKSHGKERVKTYVTELMSKIELGFFISLFTIIAGSMINGGLYVFGYYYILYAFWMFIVGHAIRFKPLIIGAYVNWAAAIAIFIVHEFRSVMIISALAILIGYLIPGYMLRAEYKRKTKKETL